MKTEQPEVSLKMMRQDTERKLAILPPLFKEEEYKPMDPEGLLRVGYEEGKKAGGELEFFKKIEPDIKKPASGNYEYWGRTRGLKEIDFKVVGAINDYAYSTALASIYFENDREKAKRIIKQAFDTLNNRVIINQPPHKNEAGHDVEGCECVCTYAESLGRNANRWGFPDLADHFGTSTLCPRFNTGGKVAPIHSQGEDYPIEMIQKRIKEDISWKIKALQHQKETEQKK